jgi:competence protein ComFC
MKNSRQAVSTWLRAALSFFYPEICQLCKENRATPSEGFVCPDCRGKVRFIEPPFCERCGLPYEGAITTAFECGNCRELDLKFSYARSAVLAKSVVLEAIHYYKYNRALWLEPFLIELFVNAAIPDLARSKWDLIVQVPLHSTKLREREFNQAERLGRGLSKAAGIPLRKDLLRRVVPTRTQTLLTREERQANVREAFAFAAQPLKGQRIVLVDDVLTTGATTSACAKVLLSAGAAEVCVWTVARGT